MSKGSCVLETIFQFYKFRAININFSRTDISQMETNGLRKEQKEVGLLRQPKNQYYLSHQIEKQLYQHYQPPNTLRAFNKISQNQRKTQQTTYNSEQKTQSPKTTLQRMNSLKNYDSPYFRSSSVNLNSAKQTQQKKSSQSNKFKDSEHQRLTDKIAIIEQKVQQMKSDLLKKKQQKEQIIKDQMEQRERWHRERYQNAQNEPVQKQKKRQQNPTVEERIKKITKIPNKVKIQSNTQLSILQAKQSSIIKDVVMQVPQPQVFHQLTQNPYSPRSNIYYVSEVIKAYKDNKSLAKEHILQSLQIMRTLQNTRMPTSSEVERKMLNLAQKKEHLNKKTLIFDMDQTLIHCIDNINKKFDEKVAIRFQNGTIIEAGINIRPYAKQILKNLYKHFEIVIFTASQSCYADQVLNLLDPHKQYITHRLYREHCFLSSQGMYIKDLRIINRPLSNQILVDNAAYSYFFQLQNGIPIIPYYQGSIDFELKQLEKYLMQMVLEKDVRRINRETFKLHRYINYYNTPNKLVQDLYINKI